MLEDATLTALAISLAEDEDFTRCAEILRTFLGQPLVDLKTWMEVHAGHDAHLFRDEIPYNLFEGSHLTLTRIQLLNVPIPEGYMMGQVAPGGESILVIDDTADSVRVSIITVAEGVCPTC